MSCQLDVRVQTRADPFDATKSTLLTAPSASAAVTVNPLKLSAFTWSEPAKIGVVPAYKRPFEVLLFSVTLPASSIGESGACPAPPPSTSMPMETRLRSVSTWGMLDSRLRSSPNYNRLGYKHWRSALATRVSSFYRMGNPYPTSPGMILRSQHCRIFSTIHKCSPCS